jgi:AcrR family transcriptional regulator
MASRKDANSGNGSEAETPRRSRRTAGEPRRLLLEAGRRFFNEKGYAGTSTREIADSVQVSESLMFRYFDSKVGLYQAAMIRPFVEFVQDFITKAKAGDLDSEDDETASRLLLGGLFDLFHSHRGLVAAFWTADVMTESELAESGALKEVQDQIAELIALGREQMRKRHQELPHQEVTTMTTMAMVIGMASFGSSFYGGKKPSRDLIVDEIVQSVMYGHDRPVTVGSARRSSTAATSRTSGSSRNRSASVNARRRVQNR